MDNNNSDAAKENLLKQFELLIQINPEYSDQLNEQYELLKKTDIRKEENGKDKLFHDLVDIFTADSLEKFESLFIQGEINLQFVFSFFLGEFTILHLAAMKNAPNCVSFLLDNGANPNIVCRGQGTPLHAAAMEGCLEALIILVERGGDLEAVDDMRNTLLHLAAERGRMNIVTYLVEKGAKISTRTGIGQNAIQLAVQNKHMEVAKFLGIKELTSCSTSPHYLSSLQYSDHLDSNNVHPGI